MNFGKALRAALKPPHWRALAHATVPTIEHDPAFVGIEPATVIDVGANIGQFSSYAAVRWPGCTLIAFEPLPLAAARYSRLMGSRAQLHRCALGSNRGQFEMHVASRVDSSSLLPLGDRQKSVFHMEEARTETIEVHRLDEILAGQSLEEPVLLKIDVQGYEYEVLKGLGDLVGKIRWIFVELSFVELYEGQKLFGEVDDLLRSLDFRFVREFGPTFDHDEKVQADCLYLRG